MAWDSCTIPMKKKEKGIGDYCTFLEFGPRQVYIYIVRRYTAIITHVLC